jgi:hypothetical protein
MPQKKKIGNAILDKHPKFAPLTLDSTFKRAFANEKSNGLLLFLLNTFLEKVLKQPICNVKLIHTVQPPPNKYGRGAVLDIHCEDALGTRFIVGMQKRKDKKIPYDFNYPIIYTLSFLHFDLDFGKDCDEVIQYLSLSNDTHPEVRYDIMRMVYVRLSRFNKTEEECKTDADMLLFTLKNADILKKMPASFKKPEFKQLFEIAKISNLTQMEHMDYIRQMMAYSDRVHALDFAKKKGRLEGEAIGMEKAAKSMLAEGLDPAIIARITKLPKKQIIALR